MIGGGTVIGSFSRSTGFAEGVARSGDGTPYAEPYRMFRRTAYALILIALVAGSGAASSACYVEEYPEPVYAEGYEPQFYDGYVVYYDDVGRPFYYVNGAVVWVSPTSPYYGGLVHHWRYHYPAYRRWYTYHGYRYRAYRRRFR